jgi:hypothetical protein
MTCLRVLDREKKKKVRRSICGEMKLIRKLLKLSVTRLLGKSLKSVINGQLLKKAQLESK